MTNPLFALRARDLARTRLPRSRRNVRTARSLTLEQVAQLAPEWGAVEARHAQVDVPWTLRRL